MTEQDNAVATSGADFEAAPVAAEQEQQAAESRLETEDVQASEPAEEVQAGGDETDETGPVLERTEPEGADSEGTEAEDDKAEDDDEGAEPASEPRSGRRAHSRPKVGQLEREGEVAADFLETLLDIADLDGDLEVDVDGDRAAVAIVDSEEGRVPRRLVGPDGKVLEALQELTRLAVQAATGERSRLMLDVAGHRAARRAALVEIAGNAIEAVRASGERQELAPMSAFERKVVHDAVLAAGLSSESEGAEPSRFVVVLPA